MSALNDARGSVIIAAAVALIVVLISIRGGPGHLSLSEAVLIGMIVITLTAYSYFRQRNAVLGKALNWLATSGFTIERMGRYVGYKGVYRGYFMRIYADSYHLLPRRRYGSGLCIMAYFQPMRTPHGERDIALLRRIEAGILNEPFRLSGAITYCRAIHMVQYTPFTLFTGPKKVRQRMDELVDRVVKYELKPWPESEVEQWVRKAPDLHGPGIFEFQDTFPTPKGPYWIGPVH